MMKGSMEWSHHGGDQTTPLYIASAGRMNFAGDRGGGHTSQVCAQTFLQSIGRRIRIAA